MNSVIKMTLLLVSISTTASTTAFGGTCLNGFNYIDDSLASSIAARGVGENTFRSAQVSCVRERMGYLTCSAYVSTLDGAMVDMHGLGVEADPGN